MVAALVALRVASRHFGAGWAWPVLAPPILAAAAGAAAIVALQRPLGGLRAGGQLAVLVPVYVVSAIASVRFTFPDVLVAILSRLHGGAVLLRWLALRPSTA